MLIPLLLDEHQVLDEIPQRDVYWLVYFLNMFFLWFLDFSNIWSNSTIMLTLLVRYPISFYYHVIVQYRNERSLDELGLNICDTTSLEWPRAHLFRIFKHWHSVHKPIKDLELTGVSIFIVFIFILYIYTFLYLFWFIYDT